MINSQAVRWMDCKGYYGSASSQSFYKKHAKQIQKYNAEFGGIGAVVFKLGYSEDLVRYIHYSSTTPTTTIHPETALLMLDSL